MKVLVLDGHDGSGKTSIAQFVAQKLEGRYIHPFSGNLGDLIAWSYRRKRYDLTNMAARGAIDQVLEIHQDASLLVFDRHWLTLFSVLPPAFFSDWLPFPPTVLCWTDPQTTAQRLALRGEQARQIEKHEHYCAYYRELALRFEVPIVDTTHTSVEEAAEEVLGHWHKLSKTAGG